MLNRPSPRLEGVEVQVASKRRLSDGTVWLNQFRVCEKLASTELSSIFRVEETHAVTGAVKSFCCKRYRKLLLLRRREYRAGPQGMGFRTKMEDVKEEARLLALLNHPRCLKLHATLDTAPDSPEGKVYLTLAAARSPFVLLPTVTNYLEAGALMVLRSAREEASSPGDCPSGSEASLQTQSGGAAARDSSPPRELFVPQLEGQRTFTEAQAKCFVRDAAEGVLYLHEELGVAHRDVKVDNLLLGADGRVCVGDFGSAEKMGAGGPVRHTKGTYMFMAPECLRPVDESKPYEGHDGRAADAWALGICTFVMIFGMLPFNAASIERLFEAVGEGVVTIPDFPSISSELRDFFRQVLQPEWRERLSVRDILTHPWVVSANPSDAEAYAKALLKQQAQRKVTQGQCSLPGQ
ncbi:hypothetical protein Efla_005771 [Eimeria flavescens]